MKVQRVRLEKFALALILLGTFPVARALPANYDTQGFTVCFFRTLTGQPCPFCGLVRAFVCAMHGQWTMAFRYHPLWWLAALIILAAGLASLADAATGSKQLDLLSRPWQASVWSMAVVLVAATLLRMSFFPLPH
jgi:fucose 4-O-acetylase-like acetyltransferase